MGRGGGRSEVSSRPVTVSFSCSCPMGAGLPLPLLVPSCFPVSFHAGHTTFSLKPGNQWVALCSGRGLCVTFALCVCPSHLTTV